jgi:large subunit ribosomal protein L3
MKIVLENLICLKAGMTRFFDTKGESHPVTVLKVLNSKVVQIKTKDIDGYEAYKLATTVDRKRKSNRAQRGKGDADGSKFNFATEVRVADVDPENLEKELCQSWCGPDTLVDVVSTSKGKGFQGVIKRYGFSGGPMSHGSHFHRRPGSIGNRATPARVFAGKKLPGRMGGKRVTMQNLEVMMNSENEGFILVRGAVPGSVNSVVLVKKAKKKQ